MTINIEKGGHNMRRRKSKGKTIFIVVIIVLILKSGLVIADHKSVDYSKPLQTRIYNYLQISTNRLKTYDKAAILNNGSTENTCVYFICEVLRENGINVSKSICNTSQLVSILQNENWIKDTNYKNLKPGVICFTTDSKLNNNGIPSHTYIFMGWVNNNSYNYAYVCDNQAKDYKGKIYHIRNICELDEVSGKSKEPFSYFLYKE